MRWCVRCWLAFLVGTADGARCIRHWQPFQRFSGSIKVLVSDWPSAQIAGHAVGILLEDVLGFTVQYVHHMHPLQIWESLGDSTSEDEGHIAMEIWPTTKAAQQKEWVTERRAVTLLGHHSVTAQDGWFVPKYMLEDLPANYHVRFYAHLQAAFAFDLYNSSRIAVRERVFAQCNRTGLGADCWPSMTFRPTWCDVGSCIQLLHGPPGISEGMGQAAVLDLGLPVEVAYMTTEELHDAVWDAYAHRQPFIFQLWAPHEKIHGLDINADFQRVEMPPRSGAFRSQFGVVGLQKAARSSLEEEAPDVWHLVERLLFTDQDYQDMLQDFLALGSADEAACAWVKQQRGRWQPWVQTTGRPYPWPFLGWGTGFWGVLGSLILAHAIWRASEAEKQSQQVGKTAVGEKLGRFRSTLRPMGAFWSTLSKQLGLPWSGNPAQTLSNCKRFILRYNVRYFVRFGPFFTHRGSVLTLHFTLFMVVVDVVLAATSWAVTLAVGWFGYLAVEDIDIVSVESLQNLFGNLLTFLLGLFVSVHVAQWLSMRDAGWGGLWASAMNSCILLGMMRRSAHGKTAAHAEALQVSSTKMLRFYLAAQQMLFQTARGHFNPAPLVQRSLLTEVEAVRLSELPSKCAAITGWIADEVMSLSEGRHLAASELLSQELTSKLLEMSMKARGSMGGVLCSLDIQMPFIYVHLISLMVRVLLVVMSLETGVALAVLGAAHVNRSVDYIIKPLKLVLNTVFYQGILEICAILRDPFAVGWNHFSNWEFHDYMEAEGRMLAGLDEPLLTTPCDDGLLVSSSGRSHGTCEPIYEVDEAWEGELPPRPPLLRDASGLLAVSVCADRELGELKEEMELEEVKEEGSLGQEGVDNNLAEPAEPVKAVSGQFEAAGEEAWQAAV